MNTSTFEKYQAASKLQGEALEAMNKLEAQADSGVRKLRSFSTLLGSATTAGLLSLTKLPTATGEISNDLPLFSLGRARGGTR